MGRPREHDEATRAALLEATERLVARGGAAALSVRAVAEEAGTTTRAVYSLFGSKDGLLVDAIARRAFEFLHAEIGKLEETDDPAADLVAVGVRAYRGSCSSIPASIASPSSGSFRASPPAPSSPRRGSEPGTSCSARSPDSTRPACCAR